MKIKKAIENADKLRPNVIDEEQKFRFVLELEAEIAELMGLEPPALEWPNDQELLMPEPYDNIYELYLMAKIDFAMEETALYANDYITANNAIDTARKWWHRNNKPKNQGRVKTGL